MKKGVCDKKCIMHHWLCLQIDGKNAEGGIIEFAKPLCEEEIKPWRLQAAHLIIAPSVSVEEAKKALDSGGEDTIPSYFALEINGKIIVNIPLSLIPVFGFGENGCLPTPFGHPLLVSWDDEVALKITFWDKKPHPIGVGVTFYRQEVIERRKLEKKGYKIGG